MKYRGMLLALALCLVLALLPGSARAAEADGKWGESITWSYNENTKTLTISGTGPMPDGAPPCNSLYNVQALVINSGITSVGAHSFESCIRLSDVTIPSSVTSIGEGAFQNCDYLTRITIPGDNVSIEANAFSFCRGLTRVTVTGSNVSVGEQAFYFDAALTDVTLSGSGNSIGNEAFSQCDALSRITFQNDVGSIGDGAFSYCDALTDVTFQGEVGSVGQSAFSYCEKLVNITFQGGAGPIGESAFSYCRELTGITFSGGVESIGREAFCYCQKLAKVAINGDVGHIGGSAFSQCTALTEVEISGNAASIGNSSFSGLKNLTSFHVTGTLGWIGNEAFSDCTGLVEFPAIDGGMTGQISIHAFQGCDGFHRIVLPEGVTIIGDYAIDCENLTALWIPASVTKITSYAFDSHTLKDIYYGGTEAQWKSIEGYKNVQYDGLPVIHYNCPRGLPETAAGDGETLRQLIHDGIGAGLTEIELTGDIDLGSDTLSVEDTCNVVLDLKGHRITSSADPAITVVGDLTVKDSTEKSSPAVGMDNRVSYACNGSISSTGLSGEMIDVQFGGSFTLLSGTVSGSSGGTAIAVTGASGEYVNPDRIETVVSIDGGYVEAGGPAIAVSGVEAYVKVNDGVVLSRGAAVILSPETTAENYVQIRVDGGTLINKRTGQLSCGIYLPQRGSVSIDSGRIIVENGIGVLLRGGGVLDMWLLISSKPLPEITAGGSGTGIIGSSNVELPAGQKIVMDHKSGYPGSDQMYFLLDGDVKEQFSPTALPADHYELKSEPFGGSDIKYSVGPIVTYQITFDSNGGTPASPSVMQTDSSGRITGFPAEPVRPGYVFRGWSTYKDELAYRAWIGQQLRRNTTLYAVWTPDGAHIISFYYYYNAVEGTSHIVDKVTGTDGVLTDWPSLQTFYGQVAGWFSNPVGGEEYSESHVFTGDTKVYGHPAPDAPPPYDITFDFNGAGGESVTKRTDEKGKLADWPADPTRDGYVFMGWCWFRDGSISVGRGETFSSSAILYAHWMPEGGYVIDFYLNQDSSGIVSETRNTNLRARLDRWPDTPVRTGTGYIFSGWYTSPTGGSRLANDHRFYGNTSLYAHWIQRSGAAAGSWVITFDPNGGTGGSLLLTERDGRLAFLPYNDPVRAGYTFDGWFTGKNDGIIVTTATVFTADTAVYAHWTANGTIPPDPDEPKTFTVTFDSQGGSAVASQTITSGEKAVRPADPTRAGHTFGGWYREEDCTTVWNFDKDTVTGNITLYAKWTPDGDTPGPDDPFTVTFDPNGGTGGGTMTTGTGGRLAALPGDPVRSGYTFAGWYTGKNDGTEVTTATVFTADTTVYAHWNRGADAGIYYRIYTPYRTPGGRFDVSHTSAAEGTRVTVELSPGRSYELDWLSATNLVTGRELHLTRHDSDEYSFIMPAGDVEVEITFAARYTGGNSGGSGGSGSSYHVPDPSPAGGKPIRWYYRSGAIYHVTDGLVPVGTLLTRDMLISVLYNLDTASTGEPELWATSHAVIPDIYKSWLWGVDKPISREQAVVILYSYAQYKNYNTFERADLTGYSDYGLIRPIAQPAMSWARATGLITGTSANTLSPLSNLTCGQAGIILARFTGK